MSSTIKTQQISISQHGNSDVLTYGESNLALPLANEVQIEHRAIGINFIDTYHRSGLYPIELPSVLGLEAAGVIIQTGSNISHLKVGDRVSYGNGPIGSYCSARNIPANKVHKIPDGVDDKTAAAIMLKGMTAYYLTQLTYPVKAGETILFHAAAGGVGQIACQWANALGAEVIGTVGSDEKAEIARANGCHHVINYSHENIAERVNEITHGKGVPVVFDGVGKSTFIDSLDSLQPRGLMVSFGNASGAVEDFNLGLLNAKGSLYVTRPKLFDYVSTDAALQTAGNAVFDMVKNGKISIAVNQSYALKDAKKAHDDLEQRNTTGASVLIP